MKIDFLGLLGCRMMEHILCGSWLALISKPCMQMAQKYSAKALVGPGQSSGRPWWGLWSALVGALVSPSQGLWSALVGGSGSALVGSGRPWSALVGIPWTAVSFGLVGPGRPWSASLLGPGLSLPIYDVTGQSKIVTWL